ncbi:MAG: T9SS type A sorting domain-containing protein [Bacteroidales bacterium]|jgi:hypothetical protein|nr:T9SS type A sorting domain-containing protein [Bacteroidales bacterium]
MIRQLALLVLMLLSCLSGLSATPDTLRSYSFFYDQSGNRNLREAEIVQLKSSSTIASDFDDSKEQVSKKELSGRTIKIYPNPTKGIIRIVLSEAGIETTSMIIYNTLGQVIAEKHIEGTEGEINLSGQSPGVYFLRIIIDGTSSEWKVLKE